MPTNKQIMRGTTKGLTIEEVRRIYGDDVADALSRRRFNGGHVTFCPAGTLLSEVSPCPTCGAEDNPKIQYLDLNGKPYPTVSAPAGMVGAPSIEASGIIDRLKEAAVQAERKRLTVLIESAMTAMNGSVTLKEALATLAKLVEDINKGPR